MKASYEPFPPHSKLLSLIGSSRLRFIGLLSCELSATSPLPLLVFLSRKPRSLAQSSLPRGSLRLLHCSAPHAAPSRLCGPLSLPPFSCSSLTTHFAAAKPSQLTPCSQDRAAHCGRNLASHCSPLSRCATPRDLAAISIVLLHAFARPISHLPRMRSTRISSARLYPRAELLLWPA